jgi:glucosamine-phosphate N-acetyltransferase
MKKELDYKITELNEKILENYSDFFETLSNMSPAPKIPYKKSKKILKLINSQNAHIFAAILEKEKKIIGTSTILIEQKFIHNGKKVGHIEDVVILKGYENNGIGKELIKNLVNYAKEKECYKVILDCNEEKIPFYEKCGFKKYENCMRLNLK